jgi:tryptophan-rich sensory protein
VEQKRAYAAHMSRLLKGVMAFVATYAAGLTGFFFVNTETSSWYASLVKPALTPPDIVFGVVWFALYALMACALAIIWTQKSQSAETEGWVRFYFVQLLFNAAWTMFFFGLHAVLIAFIDILILGFIVLALLTSALEINRRAAYFLIPYFLWILFAGYLTLRIWFLN